MESKWANHFLTWRINPGTPWHPLNFSVHDVRETLGPSFTSFFVSFFWVTMGNYYNPCGERPCLRICWIDRLKGMSVLSLCGPCPSAVWICWVIQAVCCSGDQRRPAHCRRTSEKSGESSAESAGSILAPENLMRWPLIGPCCKTNASCQ